MIAVITLVYFVIIILFEKFLQGEIYNAITIFIVVDFSYLEKVSIDTLEKKELYNSMYEISATLVFGIIAPLFYTMIFGNYMGLIYAYISKLYLLSKKNEVFHGFIEVLNFVPCIIGNIFLYIVYIFRNKSYKIYFNGDYYKNILRDSLINITILAAYVEEVNYYSYYDKNNIRYLKSYGKYSNKITYGCVLDYSSLVKGIAFLVIALFLLIKML